jgi:hypothetical protein
VPPPPTSATDPTVRIHNGRRARLEAKATERHGKAVRKKKDTSSGVSKESKVYKRQRHFATKDVKERSKSRFNRKETLGMHK